ncbi:MAG: hypothetical protein PHU46_02185 [Rhodocyclaceae bacterium]|nr:hypothetical protein [Rhodocyclaceae bacterium]
MKSTKIMGALALVSLLGAAFSAQAYDGDWKRGRVYYRSVCTACHTAGKTPGAINPSSKTKAEWNAYLSADKHAKGKDSVKQWAGQAYRNSIKATNKAAEKFATVPDAELMEDVKVFLMKGAKDGDAPASCS